MSIAEAWARAYARQAAADFETWLEIQSNQRIPDCHKLLFLQMACEKLTKAYLCRGGSAPKDLQSSHAYVAKSLHLIIRQLLVDTGASLKSIDFLVRHAKHLGQEIELLSPAVTRGGHRQDNCEYPWEDSSGVLHLPLDWTFTPSHMLGAPAGRSFLKLVRDAIARLQ